MQASLSSAGFWDFSLQIYAHEPVKVLCLQLQDEHALNVNMLLFCAYLDHLGRVLTPHRLDLIEQSICEQVKHVNNLRDQRLSLKAKQSSQYKAALQLELEAEKHMQHQIIDAFSETSQTDDAPMCKQLESLQAATELVNIRLYTSKFACADVQDKAAKVLIEYV